MDEIDLTFAANAVYRTFATDLSQGYRTKDKEYAVTLLGKALGLPTSISAGDEVRSAPRFGEPRFENEQ